jgi:hypothetical protein
MQFGVQTAAHHTSCQVEIKGASLSASNARRAFRKRSKFGIGNCGINCAKPCKRAETTITSRNYSVVTYDIDKSLDPLRDKFRMLYKIRGRINDTWH